MITHMRFFVFIILYFDIITTQFRTKRKYKGKYKFYIFFNFENFLVSLLAEEIKK